MWKSFFLAIGIFTLAFGVECLGVEKMLLKARNPAPAAIPWPASAPQMGPNKEFAPPGWMPWSMISLGAVTCIYSFTIPRRMGG